MIIIAPVTNIYYFVNDLDAACVWYAELLGSAPVEVQPRLVTFLVESVRLTLQLVDEFNTTADLRGAVAYWGVDDAEVAFAHCLERGAAAYREPSVSFTGECLCQVQDPFGNLLGLQQRAASS